MSEKIAERKLEIIIGLFLLGGIVAWLIIPTSFQDTTIILEGGGGGAPVSCLPSGGLVLAQNLTDLCDVSIDNPLTTQIIEYNGSQWVNVNHTNSITTVTSNNNNTIGVVPTTGNIVLYPKYELLCQSSLTTTNNTLTCDFDNRKYLQIRGFIIGNGSGTGFELSYRFNSNSTTSYSFRTSTNGGADSTATATTRCNFETSGLLRGNTDGHNFQIDITDISGIRKIGFAQDSTGVSNNASAAPNKSESSCKWSNITETITSVTFFPFSGTSGLGSNSSISVWGYN